LAKRLCLKRWGEDNKNARSNALVHWFASTFVDASSLYAMPLKKCTGRLWNSGVLEVCRNKNKALCVISTLLSSFCHAERSEASIKFMADGWIVKRHLHFILQWLMRQTILVYYQLSKFIKEAYQWLFKTKHPLLLMFLFARMIAVGSANRVLMARVSL
jgi:hypothetical protein